MKENTNINDLLEKVKLVEQKRKKTNIYIITCITVLTLAYITYSAFTIKKKDDEKNVVKLEFQNLNSSQLKEDSARKIIFQYFDYQNNSDSSKVYKILADTIFRYYLLDKPTSKIDLVKSTKFEINKTGKYYVDSSFKIAVTNDTLLALIKTPALDNGEWSDLLHEIKLNNKYEIFYVRAYELNAQKVKQRFDLKQ